MQASLFRMIKPYLKFSFTLDWMASRRKHAISPRAPVAGEWLQPIPSDREQTGSKKRRSRLPLGQKVGNPVCHSNPPNSTAHDPPFRAPMTNLDRRTLVKCLVLSSAALPSTIRSAPAQPGEAATDAAEIRLRGCRAPRPRSRGGAFRHGLPGPSRSAEQAGFRRLARHQVSARQGLSRRKRKPVPAATVPSRPSLQAPGDHQHDPRRHRRRPSPIPPTFSITAAPRSTSPCRSISASPASACITP